MLSYIDTDGDLVVESEDDVVYISIEDIIRMYKDRGYTVSIIKNTINTEPALKN